MAKNHAVEVFGLSKRYRLHHEARARYGSFRESVAIAARNLAQRMLRRSAGNSAHGYDEDFGPSRTWPSPWRPANVSASSGATAPGKSTLLKILSRITAHRGSD